MSVCFLFSWTGFPIPKLDMLSQLEGGEEQWASGPQDGEGRDILKATYTGEDLEILSRVSSLHVSSQRVFVFQKQDWVQKLWKSGYAGLTCSP